MRTLLPEGWPRPKGYSNGIEAEGRIVFVAGQIGWTPEGRFEATTLATQFAQTLDNTLAVLREANRPAWWRACEDVLPDWFQDYIGLEQAVPFIGKAVDRKVPVGPLQVGVAHVHGQGAGSAAGCGIHGERAGIGKQVEHTFAFGFLSHHLTGIAVVEEQTYIEVIGRLDEKTQAVFTHDVLRSQSGKTLVLPQSFLPLPVFQINQVGDRKSVV